jgi:hypothetical protein
MTGQKPQCAGCGATERLTLVNAPTCLYTCARCKVQTHDVVADMAWLQNTRARRLSEPR